MPQTRTRLDERLMKQLPAGQFNGIESGSGDVFTVTMNPATEGYEVGRMYSFIATHANNGACVVNIDGCGDLPMKKNVVDDLLPGDIDAGRAILLLCTETSMQVIGGLSFPEPAPTAKVMRFLKKSQAKTLVSPAVFTTLHSPNTAGTSRTLFGGSGTNEYVAFSVTCSSTKILKGVSLPFVYNGAISNDVLNLEIYTGTTSPNFSDPVGNGTFNEIVSNQSNNYYYRAPLNSVQLNSGTKYWFVLRRPTRNASTYPTISSYTKVSYANGLLFTMGVSNTGTFTEANNAPSSLRLELDDAVTNLSINNPALSTTYDFPGTPYSQSGIITAETKFSGYDDENMYFQTPFAISSATPSSFGCILTKMNFRSGFQGYPVQVFIPNVSSGSTSTGYLVAGTIVRRQVTRSRKVLYIYKVYDNPTSNQILKMSFIEAGKLSVRIKEVYSGTPSTSPVYDTNYMAMHSDQHVCMSIGGSWVLVDIENGGVLDTKSIPSGYPCALSETTGVFVGKTVSGSRMLITPYSIAGGVLTIGTPFDFVTGPTNPNFTGFVFSGYESFNRNDNIVYVAIQSTGIPIYIIRWNGSSAELLHQTATALEDLDTNGNVLATVPYQSSLIPGFPYMATEAPLAVDVSVGTNAYIPGMTKCWSPEHGLIFSIVDNNTVSLTGGIQSALYRPYGVSTEAKEVDDYGLVEFDITKVDWSHLSDGIGRVEFQSGHIRITKPYGPGDYTLSSGMFSETVKYFTEAFRRTVGKTYISI